MIRVKWPEFKPFLDAGLPYKYVDFQDRYYIWAFDGPFSIWCRVRSDEDENGYKEDFEDNYMSGANGVINPTDAEGAPLARARAFANSDGFRARFKGISGTAAQDTTTDIDYKLTEERYINGVRLIADNHVMGDKVDFQVVDVDNILGYGAGVVLDEFGKDWYLDPNVCTQPDVLVPYPAKILANLYIRLKYHSVGTSNDVDLKCNLFLHKKS